jgi:hypothetical protein
MSTPYRPVPAFKPGRGGGGVNRSGMPKSPRGALPQFAPSAQGKADWGLGEIRAEERKEKREKKKKKKKGKRLQSSC